jgi:long-chain acyl-CoA synthetase
VKSTDVATIIYTSGTTGVPKGVVLTHANVMHNVDVLPDYFGIKPGTIFMSILPPWHVFERTVEYIILASGVSLAYSKPLRQVLLRDFELLRPHYIASVPRVWEGLHKGILNNVRQQPPSKQKLFFTLLKLSMWYSRSWRVIEGREPRFATSLPWEEFLRRAKAVLVVTLLAPIYHFADHRIFSAIRQKMGGRLILPISGGGALPQHVDEFFDTVGLRIVEGYGLTETSPVVSARLPRKSMFRTVGPPIPFTKVEIRSLENPSKQVLKGHKGLVFVKGPQVMQGYHKNPEATGEVLSEDGWFNTGDIGRLSVNGDIQLLGRAKDTIVLLGGENVEPYPIEAKIEESPFISQAVVVGQDQKSLATLLVPDFDALTKVAEEKGLPQDPDEMIGDRKVIELFQDEVKRLISPANGFKTFERISQFRLIRDEFKVGDELTHTLKKRRGVIQQKYRRVITSMYR